MGIEVTTYGLCVDWRGINATIVPDLDKLRKASTGIVSELIDGVQDGGVRDRRLTDNMSFGVSSVRVILPAQFKLVSFN